MFDYLKVLVGLGIFFVSFNIALSNHKILDNTLDIKSPLYDVTKNITLKRGDSLYKILNGYHISKQEIIKLTKTLKKKINLSTLAVGKKIGLLFSYDRSSFLRLTFTGLSFNLSNDQKLIIVSDKNGEYNTRKIVLTSEKKIHKVQGYVEKNLYTALMNENVPYEVSSSFLNLFNHHFNLSRDIAVNDSFEIMYESFYNVEGKKIRDGNILYAYLTIKGEEYIFYRYETSKGQVLYLNEFGESFKKLLLKWPVDQSSIRISSKFGKRYHPIKKRYMKHWGVDFAGRVGLPVSSTGNGVVAFKGRRNGYGNYVIIKHNHKYSTAYGHLSRFSKGLYVGKKIKQKEIIGYLGRTGRVTGPHLHYEVIRFGLKVDPLKLRLPSYSKLVGSELNYFYEEKNRLDSLRDNLT